MKINKIKRERKYLKVNVNSHLFNLHLMKNPLLQILMWSDIPIKF